MKPDETGLIEDLLKQRAQGAATGAAAGGPLCGDPELLAAYAENSLDEEGRESFHIHLASCAACREAVAALVRMAPREASTESPVLATRWWKPRWKQWIWAPALAGLIVVGSVVMVNRQRVTEQPKLAKLDTSIEQRPPASSPAPPSPEPIKEAPAAKPPARTTPAAPARIAKKAAEEPDTLRDKSADALESAGKVGSLPAAPTEPKLMANAPVSRKQEDLQIASGTVLGGQIQNQNLANQAQNAPPPAPFVNNLQNGSGNAIVVNGQNAANESISVQGTPGKAQMLRMAPQAAKTPAPTPAASPAAGAAGAAAVFAAKAKTMMPAKGRIEKGTLQISTDGGATWQNIVTPEPVLSFQITDALNCEIRTRSLATFLTKDGGKTWQAKAPQP